MSESTGKTAAQCKSDPRSTFRGWHSARSGLASGLTIEILLLGTMRGRHMASVMGWYGCSNEAEVPAFRYPGTWYSQGPKICAASANSTSLLFDCGLRTIVRSSNGTE